jgi:FkbM family methyltransferase
MGLFFARPLSQIATSRTIFRYARVLDIYFNFLIGKGSGTGWDMDKEVETAISCIHRGEPTVIDAGANVGKWSQKLLEKLPKTRLFMCEPSPTSQAQIKNRNLNATLVPFAVGEQTEKAVLYSSREGDGSASLHQHVDSYFSQRDYQAIEVQTTTIDEIAETHGLDFIDFIKMDIEGHELFALRGARKCLEEKRIGGLLFEFGLCNLNSRTFFKDFWDVLSPNFDLYRVNPSGTPLRIDSYYEDLEFFRGATNYVAKLKSSAA